MTISLPGTGLSGPSSAPLHHQRAGKENLNYSTTKKSTNCCYWLMRRGVATGQNQNSSFLKIDHMAYFWVQSWAVLLYLQTDRQVTQVGHDRLFLCNSSNCHKREPEFLQNIIRFILEKQEVTRAASEAENRLSHVCLQNQQMFLCFTHPVRIEVDVPNTCASRWRWTHLTGSVL